MDFLNMIYPRHCPICHKIMGKSTWFLCPVCSGKMTPIGEPRCKICGKAIPREEEELCADCQAHPHIFRGGRGIFPYNKLAHESVMKYKSGGRQEYERFYIKAAAVFGRSLAVRCRPEVLIPVPMYPADIRKRGFYPAGNLARGLEQAWGIPAGMNLVRKVQKTRPQKELNREDRRKNIAHAFEGTLGNWGIERVLLVDDIYTTGSTLDAVAAAVMEHGVREVYFLTVFIGNGY